MRVATRTVVLSPHCDDAAFSLLTFLEKGVFGVTAIVNAFTNTDFTAFGRGPIGHVSAAREAEDRAVLAGVAAELHYLRLSDACVRCPSTTVSSADERSSSAEITAEVVRSVREVTKSFGAHQIVVPAALRPHLDHRICRFVGGALAAEHPVAFYADLPFEPSDACIPFPDSGLQRFVMAVPFEVKLAALRGYETQLSDSMITRLRSSHSRTGGEVLWAPPSFDLQLRRSNGASARPLSGAQSRTF